MRSINSGTCLDVWEKQGRTLSICIEILMWVCMEGIDQIWSLNSSKACFSSTPDATGIRILYRHPLSADDRRRSTRERRCRGPGPMQQVEDVTHSSSGIRDRFDACTAPVEIQPACNTAFNWISLPVAWSALLDAFCADDQEHGRSCAYIARLVRWTDI
jgi:hypothetical protein